MKRWLYFVFSVFFVMVLFSGCSWFKKQVQTSVSDKRTQENVQESTREEVEAIPAEDIDLDELLKLQEDVESGNDSVSEAQSVETSLNKAGSTASE